MHLERLWLILFCGWHWMFVIDLFFGNVASWGKHFKRCRLKNAWGQARLIRICGFLLMIVFDTFLCSYSLNWLIQHERLLRAVKDYPAASYCMRVSSNWFSWPNVVAVIWKDKNLRWKIWWEYEFLFTNIEKL